MEEKLPDGECYQEGIRYGHYWICHIVELVNDGGGHWDGDGLDSVMICYGWEVRRFASAAANHRRHI